MARNILTGKSDFIFLPLLGLMIFNAGFSAFFSGYILSINSNLSMMSWPIVLYLQISKPKIGKYGVAVLLIAGTFNILNFGLGRQAFSVGVSGFAISGLDPILFLMLIAFYIVNKHSINSRITNFFYGNAQDREKEQQKKVDFYLKKFGDCDDAEFATLYSKFKDYPEEAQIALKQINEMKSS